MKSQQTEEKAKGGAGVIHLNSLLRVLEKAVAHLQEQSTATEQAVRSGEYHVDSLKVSERIVGDALLPTDEV